QSEVVLQLQIAIDAEAVRSWIGRSIKLLYSGLKQGQVCVAAPVQGKVVNLSRIHHIADIRAFGLQQWLAARHYNFLIHGTDLQSRVNREPVLDMQNDVVIEDAVK